MQEYNYLNNIQVKGKITSYKQGELVGSFTQMPTPSQDYLNAVIVYTGATTQDFEQNRQYMCVLNDSTYSWTDITPVPEIDLEPNKVVVSDENGDLDSSAVTDEELGYLSGVTSSIQDQLDDKVEQNPTTITPGTKCKITYNENGLVTQGQDLVAQDIPNIYEQQVVDLVDDLQAKLDKVNTVGVVYATDANGQQTVPYSSAQDQNAIVQRQSNGNISVPTTPATTTDATSKVYVDTIDQDLQTQIDAIVASSDVKDIVGTYQELQNYDTSTLGNNDIIKVLQDSTHSNAQTYYRWVITEGTGAFQYIGSEGPYYTIAQTDTLLSDKANKNLQNVDVSGALAGQVLTVNPAGTSAVWAEVSAKGGFKFDSEVTKTVMGHTTGTIPISGLSTDYDYLIATSGGNRIILQSRSTNSANSISIDYTNYGDGISVVFQIFKRSKLDTQNRLIFVGSYGKDIIGVTTLQDYGKVLCVDSNGMPAWSDSPTGGVVNTIDAVLNSSTSLLEFTLNGVSVSGSDLYQAITQYIEEDTQFVFRYNGAYGQVVQHDGADDVNGKITISFPAYVQDGSQQIATYNEIILNHSGSSSIVSSNLIKDNSNRLIVSGGTTGQALVKLSGTNYDVAWSDISEVPDSSASDQGKVLTVNASGVAEWDEPDVTKQYVDDADADLQEQIDAIVVSSDVKDVVGTYAQLQAYDTSTLGNNDIVKVLQDSTHNDAQTYYRWVITEGTGAWSYIGQEGPFYTKSQTDTLLQDKVDTDLSNVDVGQATAGQVLAVNSSANGVEFADVPKELPTIASGDAGKVLQVNAGETGVEWASILTGGGYEYVTYGTLGFTSITPGENKNMSISLDIGYDYFIFCLTYTNEYTFIKDSITKNSARTSITCYNKGTTSASPVVTYYVYRRPKVGTENQIQVIGSVGQNCMFIPSGGTSGQVFKKTSGAYAQGTWQDISEVPTPTSGTDDGKVLTASSGAYSWQTPSSGSETYKIYLDLYEGQSIYINDASATVAELHTLLRNIYQTIKPYNIEVLYGGGIFTCYFQRNSNNSGYEIIGFIDKNDSEMFKCTVTSTALTIDDDSTTNLVPHPSSSDANKVLSVASGGYTLWRTPREVPAPTASDANKVLTATGQGAYSWATPQSGGGDVNVIRFDYSESTTTTTAYINDEVTTASDLYTYLKTTDAEKCIFILTYHYIDTDFGTNIINQKIGNMTQQAGGDISIYFSNIIASSYDEIDLYYYLQPGVMNLQAHTSPTPYPLPETTGSDVNKVLSVDQTNMPFWRTSNEVPAPASSDANKVLTATGANTFAWSDAPKELPATLGTAGQILTVNSGATGVQWQDAPEELPSVSGNQGKYLVVNSGATGVTWEVAYPPTTAGTSGQLWQSDGSGQGVWQTLDTTPTSNSTKAITSGAVYTANNALDARITALENLLDGSY